MTARTLLTAAVVAVAALLPSARGGEPTGTVTSDAPNLRGEFVVHNPTDIPVHYQIKWGQGGQWKSFTVKPGYEYKHWHALNGNKAPTPYVRFDNEGGDGKVTNTELHVKFGRVGYAGYGPVGNVDEAWHYEFKFRKDGRHLDLNER